MRTRSENSALEMLDGVGDVSLRVVADNCSVGGDEGSAIGDV